MTPIPGTLFDGETLTAHGVTVVAGTELPRTVRIQGGTMELEVPFAAVRFSERLAHTPRYLYLPDNRVVATMENEAIDGLLAGRRRSAAVVHWLETRTSFATVATILLASTIVAAVTYGLPALSRRIVSAVPVAIETEAGSAALAVLDQAFGPSQLPAREGARVQRQLDILLKVRPQPHPVRLEFRDMNGIANAFAIPGGTIVISDQLVELARLDQEIASVLAHELGHLEKRHGLQSVLRTSASLILVTTLTGDLSTLTTFSTTLPALLLQTGYSREFEQEADAYAISALQAAYIPRRFFANILEKLEKSRPASGRDFTYLSTHPGTADRIKAIRASQP